VNEHKHTRWSDIRARRLPDPMASAAYLAADRAIRFGEMVRRAREAAGLSQSELGRRMGTNQAAIARLEAGGVDPKLSTIGRVNRALGTELVIEFRAKTGASAD
jgi:ribosome-binding protein aMBF1 (putative translation factor)